MYSSFSFQNDLEAILKESYPESMYSIKNLAGKGITKEALHSANKREMEELRIRLQSPECLEAAMKIVHKNKPSVNKL